VKTAEDYEREFEEGAARIQAERAAKQFEGARSKLPGFNPIVADVMDRIGARPETERERLQREAENDDAPLTHFVRPFVWRDPATIPRRQWVYGRRLIRKFVSATFAPGGVGKSALELAEAMAMASGRPLLGVKPRERLRVGYWNGEDPFEETERRAAAASILHGLCADDLEGWLHLGSGREDEVIIAQQTSSGATLLVPNVEAIVATIQDLKLDVVIIDPFVSSHRVTENDNPAIDLVAKQWGKIADRTNTAIELVHHTRKTNGAETTVEDARGALDTDPHPPGHIARQGPRQPDAVPRDEQGHRLHGQVLRGLVQGRLHRGRPAALLRSRPQKDRRNTSGGRRMHRGADPVDHRPQDLCRGPTVHPRPQSEAARRRRNGDHRRGKR